jgi:hypothetical protein
LLAEPMKIMPQVLKKDLTQMTKSSRRFSTDGAN